MGRFAEGDLAHVAAAFACGAFADARALCARLHAEQASRQAVLRWYRPTAPRVPAQPSGKSGSTQAD